MIDIFLLILTIIVIISISILIYTIINNKEGFTNIDDTIDIKEARLKLDLEKNLIDYQKGSTGIYGGGGDIGNTPIQPLKESSSGPDGSDGKDGKSYGDLYFKNDEINLDSLVNPNKHKNDPFNIQVPITSKHIKGKPGVIGTILFVNHKKEIIGSHYPSDDDTYAKTLKPIIIDVPQGIVGDDGEPGTNGQHPEGQQGQRGERGERIRGQRGKPGINPDKGDEGGGGDEDIFDTVKVNNKVCFKEDNNVCIDIDILKTFQKHDDYKTRLENRRLRIIKQLCHLEFYNEYNYEKHVYHDDLILLLLKHLQEIYDYNGEVLNYYDIVKKLEDGGTCPAFPEKLYCNFNKDHLDITNEYLLNNCGNIDDQRSAKCVKFKNTNCGTGEFISRVADKEKVTYDGQEYDVYTSDNKCKTCAMKKWNGENEKGEIYVGCDGIYDGLGAKCEGYTYIKPTGDDKGYECLICDNCPSEEFKTGGCKGTENTTCTECIPSCKDGEYQEKECNIDKVNGHDRICKPCTTSCARHQYMSGSCNKTKNSNNSCNPCPARHYCNGGRTPKRCIYCNSNQQQVSACNSTTQENCISYSGWKMMSGSKVGGGSPGRNNTWAVCEGGSKDNKYKYTLIYWGKQLIHATGGNPPIITHQISNGVWLQFRKGAHFSGDNLKLNWGWDKKHSTFQTYGNAWGFNRYTHWADADNYDLEYRVAPSSQSVDPPASINNDMGTISKDANTFLWW